MQVWYTRLKDACAAAADAKGKRPPRLVVDVGANFGYYSLYAAAMGCRCALQDPPPHLPWAVFFYFCFSQLDGACVPSWSEFHF